MTTQENADNEPLPFVPAAKPAIRRTRLHPLHEAAMRIADLGFSRPRSRRTRELVALLMCHGARAWRASQPRTSLRLTVFDDSARTAIRLRIGA